MMRIESLDAWNRLLPRLVAYGYDRYCTQHDVDDPEGYHAWFWSSGRPDLEIVTHNKDVKAAIMAFECR
jgi:hypothetical protein